MSFITHSHFILGRLINPWFTLDAIWYTPDNLPQRGHEEGVLQVLAEQDNKVGKNVYRRP